MSKQLEHRESSLRILSSVPELLASQNAAILKEFFGTMMTTGKIENQVEGLKAFTAYMIFAEKNHRNSLAPLLVQTVDLLNRLISNEKEELLVDALASLVELSEECATLWKALFPSLSQLLIFAMSNQNYDNSTRHTALEVFLTISEIAPGTVKKNPNAISACLTSIMNMITEIEDDEDWFNRDEKDDDDEDENFDAASQALDRISIAIGGKLLLPTIFAVIPAKMDSARWQDRYGTLMSIAAFAEGCSEQLESNLDSVLNLVFSKFNDPHDRVKYAACHAIGQLSSDFSAIIQGKYHQQVMYCLIQTMKGQCNDRVKAHAAAATINFADSCESEIIALYLDQLLEALLALLNSQKMFLLEQTLSTLSTVADAASVKFAKYHSTFIPLLMNVMVNAGEKQHAMVRARSLECISLIAVAIGKDMFAPYANDYINVLIAIQNSNLPDDDPVQSYLSSAWVRMCTLMEQNFVPLLDNVMPYLIKMATVEPDLALLDLNDETDEYGNEWDFVNVNGKKFGIKTSTLDEKCSALDSLNCYCHILGAGFQKYAEQVLKIMVPLFKFDFHDGVKISAVSSVPPLFDCFLKANADKHYVMQMWTFVAKEMLASMSRYYEAEFVAQVLSNFHDVLEILGKEYLSNELLASFETELSNIVKEVAKGLSETQERDEDEDEDAGNEDEENVLTEVSRCIHILFKLMGMEFVPLFEKYIPFFTSLLNHSDAGIQHLGICIFDDLIEFTGSYSFKHFNAFGKKLVEGLKSHKPELRQAAAYGVGLCAKFGGESYGPFCAECIPLLFNLASQSNSRLAENVTATENIISAIAKIVQFNSAKLSNIDQIVGSFLQLLPVKNDLEEVPHVYGFVVSLVELSAPFLIQSKPMQLSCFKALLDFVAFDLSTEMMDKVVGAAKKLTATLQPAEMNSLLSGYNEAERAKISKYF